MSDNEYKFEYPQDAQKNRVRISISTEKDCDIESGEYEMLITGFIGSLTFDSTGGNDDIALIKEAIENDVINKIEAKDGIWDVILKSEGEWDDVFWNAYYTVESIAFQEI